ncbi:MAG: SRPBCC family protein [Syntrophobacteraceae bacterium]
MLIREEIRIEAPLATVWSVFTSLKDWEKWNSVCRAAFLKDSEDSRACCLKPISQGDCISFAIKPMIFPVRIAPRIIKFIPEKEVVWEGGRFGIRGEHTFTFTEDGECVVVASTEKLKGPGLFLSRLVLVPARLHRLTHEMLLALKREAESRSPSTRFPD